MNFMKFQIIQGIPGNIKGFQTFYEISKDFK